MQFAEILSQLMREKDVTAYRIGKDTGISNRLITYWKDGEKMPGAENLKKLADYFCVSTDYLLGKVQNKKPVTQESNELTELEKIFISLPQDRRLEVLRYMEFLADQEQNQK